jgi:hypothetical protein
MLFSQFQSDPSQSFGRAESTTNGVFYIQLHACPARIFGDRLRNLEITAKSAYTGPVNADIELLMAKTMISG